ncbi:hypothetical protein DPX16_8897 [Anabarilius grahami]|uniref:DUF6729 domain-containing protein n=1 Tax=Anabarilius grahami TaxID=495550 RepID=A0A3N0YD13_ANAGA|nr:hypothetical protein DPX16_8897 [Anabarilius grahami]
MPYHLWKFRLFCPACGKQLAGYGIHKRARKVLDIDRYACDIRVVRMLRERTLGNSPTRLVKQLRENHGLLPVVCQKPPEPIDVPTSKWLLSVYGRDIISHIDHIKAALEQALANTELPFRRRTWKRCYENSVAE